MVDYRILEDELKDISTIIHKTLADIEPEYNLEEILEALRPYAHTVEWGVFDSIGSDPKDQFDIVYSKDGVHIQHNHQHNYMDVVGLNADDFQSIALWLMDVKDPAEGYLDPEAYEDYEPNYETPDPHYEDWDEEDSILTISKEEYHQLIFQIETLKERIKELEGK